MKPFLMIGLVILLSGCPKEPSPPIVEVDDAGEYPGPNDDVNESFPDDSQMALSSPCGKACVNLAKIPCREGMKTDSGISCYRGCLSQARHQKLPLVCWSLASTPSEARACGGIRCLTP